MAARLAGKARSCGMVHDLSLGVRSDSPRTAFILKLFFLTGSSRDGYGSG